MPYYEQSPLAAAANFLGEYYSARDQRRKDDEDRKRQAQIDQQNWIIAQAQLADEQARQMDAEARLKEAQQRQIIANRRQGLDANGNPIALPKNLTQIRANNKGKGGAPTEQELADHASQLAAFYYAQGADYPAKGYAGQANMYGQQSYRSRQLANAASQFAERVRHDKALEGQGGERLALESERIAAAVARGQMSESMAEKRLTELQTYHAAILRLGVKREQGVNTRFNVNQKNAAARFKATQIDNAAKSGAAGNSYTPSFYDPELDDDEDDQP